MSMFDSRQQVLFYGDLASKKIKFLISLHLVGRYCEVRQLLILEEFGAFSKANLLGLWAAFGAPPDQGSHRASAAPQLGSAG
jgi:hypothetical protein